MLKKEDTQKKGRPLNNNIAQNRQFRQAITAAGINKRDKVLQERIKRCVEHCSRDLGMNLSYKDILRIANFMSSSPAKECKCDE